MMVMKRTDFEQFILWGRVWQIFKELIFNSFLLWEDVVVMKQLIFNSFYFMVGFAGP